jgi:hypothetical protein
MDVQVLGKVAVGQGGGIENSFRDGQDVSGEVVWMDLFEKRAGTGVLVRSSGVFVK